MSVLALSLLGSPNIAVDDAPVSIRRRKALALLIYLAVTQEPHTRETLATLFWPDYDEKRARAYLRRAIAAINEAIGKGWLAADPEQVALDTAASVRLDVDQLRQLLAAYRLHEHFEDKLCVECTTTLVEAVDLYLGDFMVGFTLPDCPAFDNWQFYEREALRRECLEALEQLVQSYSQQAEYAQAITFAQRLLALEPLQELAHRHLMQLYAWSGQQAVALRQYQECVRLLKDELDVPPEEETTALFEAIKARRLPPPPTEVADKDGNAAHPLTSSPAHPFDSAQGKLVTPALDPVVLDDLSTENPKKTNVFVARERELATLQTTLDRVRQNVGQPIFVIGGPGYGKTTLVQEFARRAQAADPNLIVLTGQCSAHTGIGDPFLPFREVLNQLFSAANTTTENSTTSQFQVRRLRDFVPISLPLLIQHAPDLLETFVSCQPLLTLMASTTESNVGLLERLNAAAKMSDANLEQSRIFAQITAFLRAIASQQPLCVILEDLHWADAASISLLFHLSRHIEPARILILGTYRPSELALGTGEQTHTLAAILGELKRYHGNIWLDLEKIDGIEGREFVDAYLDSGPNRLSENFRQALSARTAGHPLFMVELLHHLQENGSLQQDKAGRWVETATVDWRTLPVKIEGVIEQRLTRLDNALLRILTIASIEGEFFTAEVIAEVQECNPGSLVERLSHELDRQHHLVRAESIDHLGPQRLSRYRFRHHLFQHFLYERLDPIERTYLHEAVGTALEKLYGDQTDQVAVQLARHYEAAGAIEKAVKYLLSAGKQSSQLSANEEAIGHLSHGLSLLSQFPASAAHTQQELAVQLALGPAYRAQRGYTAPELLQSYDRAYALCQQLDDRTQLFPILWGMFSYYLVRPELQRARELAEECLSVAQTQQDQMLLTVAHRALGTTHFMMGNLVPAQEHLEQVVALYQSDQHRGSIHVYGMDNGVAGLSNMAWLLWLRGYPDQARDYILRATSLARHQNHPFSQAFALIWQAVVHEMRREVDVTQEHAEAAIALADEFGLAQWRAYGVIVRGWALSQKGESAHGIALLQQGLGEWREMASTLGMPHFLAYMAEAYGAADETEAGLQAVHKAIALVEEICDSYWEADLYRLKGEFLLRQNDLESEAATAFQRAIEIARHQRAKSLELRATTSLSKLWQQQGKVTEAHFLLAEIYGWFSEGFDTADLQDAKALLDSLEEIVTQKNEQNFVSSVPQQAHASALLHNLPSQPTTFIGREQELDKIKHLLLEESDCRLLTLVGPGGIGKTRLALQAAVSVQNNYPQDVCFVPLTSIHDPEFIVSAIAEVLKISFQGGGDPKKLVLNYVRQKEILLVLDNFEHLLAGVELLAEILSVAPQVQLLVTSRERLNLQEEWAYEVQGMAYPTASEDGPEVLNSYSATQLFLQRARRAKADFTPTDEDTPHLIRICQLVNGMPLGLELAATWIRMMSCQEIAHEIAQNVDFLATSMRNLPERHRSLRAVFEQSWQLLTEQEQAVFRKLSIFQGGCTRDAAVQSAGATLPLLSALNDKSLLRRTQAGRYEIHELLRQFAAERLAELETEQERVEAEHGQYYTALLKQRERDLKGHGQKDALVEILAEIDNVRHAWRWAVAHGRVSAIEDAVDGLWSFYEIQGWFHEGIQIFDSAVKCINHNHTSQEVGLAGQPEEEAKVKGQLLAYQGWFCWRVGLQQRAMECCQNSITILRNSGEPAKQALAFAYYALGVCDLGTGNRTLVTSNFQTSLNLYEETSERWGQAIVSVPFGEQKRGRGKLKEAVQMLQKSVFLLEELGDRRHMKFGLGYLGYSYRDLGRYEQAEHCLQKSYQISLSVNDQVGIAWALIELGHFAIKIGQNMEAQSYLQDGLHR